jgi:hypothetical protein
MNLLKLTRCGQLLLATKTSIGQQLSITLIALDLDSCSEHTRNSLVAGLDELTGMRKIEEN